jgi:hypothetical protein
MQSIRRMPRWLAGFLAASVLVPRALEAQPWDPESLIVWKDERREVAVFVPAPLLLASVARNPGDFTLDGVPMDPELRRGFTGYVKRATRGMAFGARRFYLRGESMCEEGELTDPSTFLAWLRDAPLVVLGRVVATQPGLSTYGPIVVVSRQFLEVEKVLSGEGAQVGEVISFLQPGGRLDLVEIELLNAPDDGRAAEVGERLVMAGRRSLNTAGFWLPTAVLEISDASVKAPRCVDGGGKAAWSLEELRANLNKSKGGFQ